MTSKAYYRPITQSGAARPKAALSLAGGLGWFTHVERLARGQAGEIIPLGDVPDAQLETLSQQRPPICGLGLDQPRLMGVLNTTPDSFSDGGRFDRADAALAQARTLISEGADILDIGGESTRPGADYVDPMREIDRTVPLIKALQDQNVQTPISIDTRKAPVAVAALEAGAGMVNDVSALSFDDKMAGVVGENNAPVCLMHASGDPKTMQDNPEYEDVVLDVYDYLNARVAYCVGQGIDRSRIVVDPGIGFGKTKDHNLTLIRNLSLFHGLGCAILLGVSRKRFIGTIGGEPVADLRAPGSIAVGLEGLRQGVQMLRVHDIRETRQAVSLWQAIQ